MTLERIKEIQQETAYPNSVSVQQALLNVWNECEQERVKNWSIPAVVGRSEQLILFAQFVQNDYYVNGIEHAEIIVDRWLNREKN